MQRSAFSFCLAAAFLAATVPAFALQTLDGWGAYKFGMTPDQVRGVPGQSFGGFRVAKIDDENVGSMAAQKNPTINGISYTLIVHFHPLQKMSNISLANIAKTSQPECEKRFLTLLSQSEKSYGVFSPADPQHPQDAQDRLPSSLVWKSHAASRYQLSTIPRDEESAYVWEARKSDGPKHVDIRVTWIAKEGETGITCLMDINYNDK